MSLKMAANKSPVQKQKELSLPISRIKTIMKSSPDVENISQDSLHLVAKATELFIQYVTQKAFEEGGCTKDLQYSHIAEIVEKNDNLLFLKEIVPKKITYREYKELLKKKKQNFNSDDEFENVEESESSQNRTAVFS
ncbi:chromatin accessibility complex protein 1 [Schistocerca piceifrons]|uniref:chromatin accessibility complex protein 1 n=1 Tax=Schistocerca piceifrons TaxID=274613 RepID=UPI001F5E4BE4|nr:chromatin accessibility complex protein 1 [Schistocerca piceifrons]XP_049782731.1 chromatin accessibility complex protein 1 [Schistocerca cancellata]XP_049801929.1 chromatin accessibility complex protein 1 [Schistocerca nitens]XP_049863807.1 chromatin accessibility complex protein 1-like [Schistocerca gregaria]XP_049950801.1 chromatin accessibility complex protein 1 [Schistocerca serialis cubense]